MTRIIIILLGLFLAYIGGYSCLTDLLKRKRCKEITNGKVIDIYENVKNKSDGRTKVFLYPIFEYNVMGNTYTEKFDVGSRGAFFKIYNRSRS